MMMQGTSRTEARLGPLAKLAIGAIAVLAVITAAWVTRYGPGLTVDSISYVSAAKSLLESGKLLIPDFAGGAITLRVFPPGYSAVLAALTPLAGSPLAAARDLNLALFALNTVIFAAIVWRVSKSARLVVALTAVFAMAPDVLWVHCYAMSDALSLGLFLTGLWCLLRYDAAPHWAWLAAAGLFAGANCLCRYVAIAQMAAGFLFVLASARGSWAKKGGAAVFFGFCAVWPPVIWTLLQGHEAAGAGRVFGNYGLGVTRVLSLARTIGRWFVPLYAGPYDMLLLLALVSLAILLVFLLVRGRGRPPVRVWIGTRGRVLFLFLASIVFYECVVLLAAWFLDPGQAVGGRIQVAPFALLLLSLATLAPELAPWFALHAGPLARRVAQGGMMLFLCGYLAGFAWWVSHANTLYLAYANDQWRTSPTLAHLKELPTASLIYTNGYALAYFDTQRADVWQTPYVEDNVRHTPNPHYEDEVAAMLRNLQEHSGVLVHFDDITGFGGRYPTREELEKIPGLRLERAFADGAIFISASPAPPQ